MKLVVADFDDTLIGGIQLYSTHRWSLGNTIRVIDAARHACRTAQCFQRTGYSEIKSFCGYPSYFQIVEGHLALITLEANSPFFRKHSCR
ncbi:hypothetical protein D3C73_646830 [compost metagenome]